MALAALGKLVFLFNLDRKNNWFFSFLGFLLPHKVTGFLEGTLSDELISNYRDDLDFQNFIDLLQTDFDCCGISSAGYKDWSKNVYFNCTINEEDNPSPERCGVPYSCCLPSARFAISGEDMLPNTMCGYQVQLLPERNVTTRINTQGCVPIIRNYVEGNLYTVAGIALGVALAQLLVIWLSRTLEGQIENQRALWKYSSAHHWNYYCQKWMTLFSRSVILWNQVWNKKLLRSIQLSRIILY